MSGYNESYEKLCHPDEPELTSGYCDEYHHHECLFHLLNIMKTTGHYSEFKEIGFCPYCSKKLRHSLVPTKEQP